MKKKHLTLRLYRDKKNEFRWTLIASNGRKLADSGEGYKRHKTMDTSAFIVLTGEAPEFLLASLEDFRSDIIIQDDTVIHAR